MPAAASCGMSRMLLTISTAQANRPATRQRPTRRRELGAAARTWCPPSRRGRRRRRRRPRPGRCSRRAACRRCRTRRRRRRRRRPRAATRYCVVTTTTMPATAARPKNDERDVQHRLRLDAPDARQARRPDAVVVGAADAVRVVVRVVDADLQEHRDGEAEQRQGPGPSCRSPGRRRCRERRGRRPAAACAGALRRSSRAAVTRRSRRSGRPGRPPGRPLRFLVAESWLSWSSAPGESTSWSSRDPFSRLGRLGRRPTGSGRRGRACRSRAAGVASTRTMRSGAAARPRHRGDERPRRSAQLRSRAVRPVDDDRHLAPALRAPRGRPPRRRDRAARARPARRRPSDTFTPPEMITSSSRPVTVSTPSASTMPASPVRYQRAPSRVDEGRRGALRVVEVALGERRAGELDLAVDDLGAGLADRHAVVDAAAARLARPVGADDRDAGGARPGRGGDAGSPARPTSTASKRRRRRRRSPAIGARPRRAACRAAPGTSDGVARRRGRAAARPRRTPAVEVTGAAGSPARSRAASDRTSTLSPAM